MVFDSLQDSLRNSFKKLSNALFVDDTLINELVKDLQRSLLQADVHVKLVFSLGQAIKTRIKEEKTPQGLSKKEHLTHIVYEELANFLGAQAPSMSISKKPFTIMLVGLFGNGKTTTTAKLAKFYAKRGFRVAMLSTDTWRPAAFVQLQQLGKQIDVPVFGDPQQKDPLAIYASFQKQLQPFDIVLVDTAGRDALNEELTAEITTLRQGIDAQEVFLVMSGDMGQSAQSQAEVFHQTCKVSGIIITKLDGTAKGGGALAACAVTGAPVRFIGLGEKVDALEEFKPKNFVGRLLGMGDLEALLEKTQEAFTQTEALDLSKRLLKGEFTLIDMYEQMESVKKMGPLTKVMELIPGFSQAQIPKEALKVQESKMKTWRYIMDSCTQYELEEPETISGSRVERIALGSGCADTEVRELIKQYKQAKKMVKMFKGGGSEKKMQQTMKQMMGKMKGGGFKF